MQSSEALAGRIAGILEEKKAKDIVTLDISNMTPLEALNTLNRLQNKIRNRW